MIKKYFNNLEKLIDKKLNNGTVMVVIISVIVTCTWFFSGGVNANLTSNVLQSQKNTIQTEQYITIGEKKYRIILEEIN